MKKTWVALAVLGAFAGVAQAQSSVTLYGIADVNIQLVDPKTNADSTWRVQSGHQSGSRWGLRGSEALGGGLSAIFTLEGGYDIDTGNSGQSGRLFGRQAWAGVEGGWGSLVMGRLASLGSGTGSWDMFGRVDPMLTGFGGLNLAFSIASAQRYDNGILYRSKNMGGFMFGLEHSRQLSGAEVANNSSNTYMTGIAGSFESGPFFAAATYNQTNNPAVGFDKQKNFQIGGTFDIGNFRLHAGYAMEDDVSVFGVAGIPTLASNSAYDADAWMLGVTWRLGAMGALFASYNSYDADKKGTEERDFTRWGVAWSYPLSRRTNLYLSFADNDGKNTLNNNNSYDYRQYTAGVRHLF